MEGRQLLLSFWLVVVVECLVVSGGPLSRVSDPHWYPATATWYGSPDGDGSDGGACGYGSLVDVKPLRARVGAVSPVLFKGGEGCGACYKVKCLDDSICSRRAVTVIITDECPGGYCSAGRTHFDLSGAAFGRMAVAGDNNELRNRGEISVIYRRTPCKYPGKNIAFHVNEGSTDYWLSLLVEFEDGDGDVGSMHIREKIMYNISTIPKIQNRIPYRLNAQKTLLIASSSSSSLHRQSLKLEKSPLLNICKFYLCQNHHRRPFATTQSSKWAKNKKTSKRKRDEYHAKEESPHANTSNNVDMQRVDPPFVSFRSPTIPPLSKRCRLLEPYSNEEEKTL